MLGVPMELNDVENFAPGPDPFTNT
jgi:hypothetical protein